MKRQWDIEDLIEHFTLVEDDLKILANKTGATRLGCVLLLKCFMKWAVGEVLLFSSDMPKILSGSFIRTALFQPPLPEPCWHLSMHAALRA
jgi:hypothetical protein